MYILGGRESAGFFYICIVDQDTIISRVWITLTSLIPQHFVPRHVVVIFLLFNDLRLLFAF